MYAKEAIIKSLEKHNFWFDHHVLYKFVVLALYKFWVGFLFTVIAALFAFSLWILFSEATIQEFWSPEWILVVIAMGAIGSTSIRVIGIMLDYVMSRSSGWVRKRDQKFYPKK